VAKADEVKPDRADNTFIFNYHRTIPPAEVILRSLENAHDAWLLMEMNGERCAGRQVSRLHQYDRPARVSRDSKLDAGG